MLCGFVLIVAAIFPRPVPASQYKLVDLGTLGGENSYAEAINDSGQVAGRSDNSIGQTRAFLRKDDTLTDIGGFEDGLSTFSYGINYSGQVVGSAAVKELNQWGWEEILFHAVLWTDQGINDLGTLGGKESCAIGIDFFGQVVGKAQDSNGNYHAFLWKENAMTDLGSLPGGNESCANAINALQHVAGYSATSDGNYRAFIWNKTDGMIDLGTLSGGNESRAHDLNNSGQTVGYSTNGDGCCRAVIWDNTEIRDLGTLGGDSSEALGMNDAGQVVGRSRTGTDDYHAFIWSGNQMTDLNTLVAPGSEWILEAAKDINSNGWIVATGGKDYTRRAFLLMPEIRQSIYGKITENTLGYSMPVNGVEISITNTETGVKMVGYTGENGVFLIPDLPVSTYTVRISADSFMEKILNDVQVSEGADVDISGILALKGPSQGDANGNNKLDISDAVYVLQVISGIRSR